MKKKLSGPVIFGFFAGVVVYVVALCVCLAAASALSRAVGLDLFLTRDGAVAAVIAAVCTNNLAIAVFGLCARRAPGALISFGKLLIVLAAAAAVCAILARAYYLLFYPAMSILLCMIAIHRETVSLREAETDEAANTDGAEKVEQ